MNRFFKLGAGLLFSAALFFGCSNGSSDSGLLINSTSTNTTTSSDSNNNNNTNNNTNTNTSSTAKLVGISMPDESGSWPTVVSEMKTQLTAAGYAVEAKYAGANAQTQIAQIEALIAKNVSCLVITAENSGALTEILASAKAKKFL